MKHDGEESETSVPVTSGAQGTSRNQNVVYVMPHDWTSVAQFLAPIVQRIDESAAELQILVITSNHELAAVVTAAAARLVEGRDVPVVAATSARRTARLLKIRPSQLIAGAPETLVELLRSAALKLDTVRVVCIAWADELVARGELADLETVMTEVPKEAARTVVTAELTPAVEETLERYARRARRVVAPVTETDLPVNIEYVTVSPQTKLTMLRRLLDELDPQSAMTFARNTESETHVRDLFRALGYGGSESPMTVGLAAPPGTDVVVLFDMPATREELREAASAARRAIALVQPSQFASLRLLAAGGSLTPITLPESGARARDRDGRVRSELRAVLESGEFGRELLSLEPLLDRFDGIEIAAAALQLLERERAARASAAKAAPSTAPSREREVGPVVRLFVNVGARDNVRPGDLVGAIANEAGITSNEVGKIDVRESHSVVEVAAAVADTVIQRVTGTPIRGRRAVVRLDEGGAKREGGGRKVERAGGSRGGGARRGERTDRGSRPRSEGRQREDDHSRRPSSRFPRPSSRNEDRE
ncbi:MAG TPA: DbpA RNA binding domain-containing protein [Gemmatimonadaceae bacterium]